MIAAFAMSFSLLLFDNEPRKFPLQPHETAVDCYYCAAVNFSQEQSRFRFKVHTEKAIQYPQEVLFELLHVNVQSHGFTMDISYRQFGI